MQPKFKLGLIINPIAGMGGSVGLKGTDGVLQQAIELGATPQAHKRVEQSLMLLKPYVDRLVIHTVAGCMGAELAQSMGFDVEVLYTPDNLTATATEDTLKAAEVLKNANLDILLFAGGDGTARNICQIVGDSTTVLGVPAGVKIHSGVYALTPKAAGRVVEMLINGELITLAEADVMDIDEEQFRQGRVLAKRYGEMQVPTELRYVQATKVGGKESDEMVLMDIAADVIEQMDEMPFIMGSGSTVAFVMEELGLDNSLLGVDVIHQQQLIASDVTAAQLAEFVSDRHCKLVITLIGGQGHIIGRGNQQLSPKVLKQLGKDNIIVVATKTKLQALNGRPLIVDSGDEEVNRMLSGTIKVTTGYHDYVLYNVASPE